MDNYVVGKPDDLARSVLGEKMEDFTPYDFAVMDTAAFEETPEDLRRVADCSEGWYGIKKVDTGFDSNELQIVADYYGGGCAAFLSLDPKEDYEIAIQFVTNLILQSMCMERCSKRISDWEEKTDCMVYYVIEEIFHEFHLLHFLHVSWKKENWEIDKKDIANREIMVCIQNLDDQKLSTYGYIPIQYGDGIVRKA